MLTSIFIKINVIFRIYIIEFGLLLVLILSLLTLILTLSLSRHCNSHSHSQSLVSQHSQSPLSQHSHSLSVWSLRPLSLPFTVTLGVNRALALNGHSPRQRRVYDKRIVGLGVSHRDEVCLFLTFDNFNFNAMLGFHFFYVQ